MKNQGGMIDRGKLLIRLLEISAILPAELSSSKSGELAKKMINLANEISLSYLEGFFNVPQNLTTWSRRLYFPSQGRRATDFYHP
jgi:hypothetical protein